MTTNGMPGMVTPATFNVSDDDVHFPPHRRHLDRKMRIVGENRPARRGARSVDDPAVAHAPARRATATRGRAGSDRRLLAPLAPVPRPLCPRALENHRRPFGRVREQFERRAGPSSSDERIPQQLGPVVLAKPPREQLADRERIDRRPRLRRRSRAADARAAAGRAPPTSRRSRPPRNSRTPFGRPAACAPTRARPPAGARASETADRSQRSPRRAAPTAGPMPHGDTAPSARAGRVPADSRPPARRPRRIRQRHEARRTRRTALRPAPRRPARGIRPSKGGIGAVYPPPADAGSGEEKAKKNCRRLLLLSRPFY